MARPQAEPPPGFAYLPDVLSPAEAAGLAVLCAGLVFSEVTILGRTAKRRTAHFGVNYGYESWELTPAAPIPGFLLPLRDRLARAAGEDPARFTAALVSEYPEGAGIGWHRDAPMFGPTVLGASLSGRCVLRLRLRTPSGFLYHYRELLPGSGYVLAGDARRKWQHSIPSCPEARYSVTFRSV